VVIRQTAIPSPRNTKNPIFRPRHSIILETATTLQAVPVIISAIGAVAQSSDGASLLPARVPARCIKGSVEPAMALLILRSHTFWNEREKIRAIVKPIF